MSVLDRSLPRATEARLDLRLLTPVFTTVFVGMLWWIGFRPFVSQAAGDIGTSVPVIGQILSAGALVSAAAGLFSGPLADHYGHRRSILLGLALLTSSATLVAVASHVVLFALGFLLGGLGMTFTYGVAFAVVSTHFVGEARKRALGMTQAAASMAILVGLPALVIVAALVLWRGAFLLLAGLLLLALASAYRFLPPDIPSRGRCASPRAILGKYQPLLGSSTMRVLYLVSTLRAVVAVGLPVYLGAFYVDQLGFSTREVGVAFMLEGAGHVLGNLAGGGRLGAHDQRKTLALGLTLIGGGAVAIYALQPDPFAIVGLAMGIAFVSGVTFTSLAALLAGETSAGAATTMVLSISTIACGTALGSTLGATLLRVGGYELIGVSALLTALLAVSVLLVPRRAEQAP